MLEDDELLQIRRELEMQQSEGWQNRRYWIASILQEKGKPLMLGTIDGDRQRHQTEGWCQALNFILDRDAQIEQAFAEAQAQEAAKDAREELEGGDYGVSYEAAG